MLEQHLGHRTYAENLRFGFSHQPQIVTYWSEITYYEANGWIERLPLPSGARGLWRGRQQARRALRSTDCDVVLFNTQAPAALAGGLARRRPYLIATDITPRQYDAMASFYRHRADRPGLIAEFKHRINRHLFQRAVWVLPWSHWVRDSLIRDYGVSPDRIRVIPPGVDVTRWRPRRERQPGPLRVLFIGGDFERKGGPILLAALRRIEMPVEAHLVTRSPITSGSGMYIYRDLTPNSPRLIELCQQADVFVFPTQAEAFGIAAVEAIACGVPVIATASGGLTDIVIDGTTGFLVPPNDPDAVAARIRHLIEQPDARLRMARAARQHAETMFDAVHNAAQIAELMAQAVIDAKVGSIVASTQH